MGSSIVSPPLWTLLLSAYCFGFKVQICLQGLLAKYTTGMDFQPVVLQVCICDYIHLDSVCDVTYILYVTSTKQLQDVNVVAIRRALMFQPGLRFIQPVPINRISLLRTFGRRGNRLDPRTEESSIRKPMMDRGLHLISEVDWIFNQRQHLPLNRAFHWLSHLACRNSRPAQSSSNLKSYHMSLSFDRDILCMASAALSSFFWACLSGQHR